MNKVNKISKENLKKINQCSTYYIMFMRHGTMSTKKKYLDIYNSLDYVGKKQVLTNIKIYLEEQEKRKLK